MSGCINDTFFIICLDAFFQVPAFSISYTFLTAANKYKSKCRYGNNQADIMHGVILLCDSIFFRNVA